MDAGLDLFARDIARKRQQHLPELEKLQENITQNLNAVINSGWSPERAQLWFNAEFKLAAINKRINELLPPIEGFYG